jgi:hypothetical protein
MTILEGAAVCPVRVANRFGIEASVTHGLRDVIALVLASPR